MANHESVFSPLNSVISGFDSLVLMLHLFLVLRFPLHPFSQIQTSSSVFLFLSLALMLVFAPVGTFNAPVPLTFLDNLVLLLVYLILFLIRLWYLRMHWFYRLHRFPSLVFWGLTPFSSFSSCLFFLVFFLVVYLV